MVTWAASLAHRAATRIGTGRCLYKSFARSFARIVYRRWGWTGCLLCTPGWYQEHAVAKRSAPSYNVIYLRRRAPGGKPAAYNVLREGTPAGACSVFRNAIVEQLAANLTRREHGSYASGNGNTGCASCTPGYYTNYYGASACNQCGPGSAQANYYATGCPVCSPGTYQVCMQPRGRVSFSGCNSCNGLPVLPPTWGHFGTLCNALGMLMSLYWVCLRHRTNGPIRVV
jgi:hypothetical protein